MKNPGQRNSVREKYVIRVGDRSEKTADQESCQEASSAEKKHLTGMIAIFDANSAANDGLYHHSFHRNNPLDFMNNGLDNRLDLTHIHAFHTAGEIFDISIKYL